MAADLLTLTDAGLFCPAGEFHVDPWRGVDRAVITHAHGDHARRGSKRYLCATPGAGLLQLRMGDDAVVQGVSYGEPFEVNGVRVSFHPAGHVLGSAQVRVEHRGEVWVVSGDYKNESDPTCQPFEPVRCHTFITESTFGLPIYRWRPQREVFDEIDAWWRRNAAEGRASAIFAYSLGKAQRLLAGVDASIGPIYTHGAVQRVTEAYRASGIPLPSTTRASGVEGKHDWRGSLIVAPPSTQGTPWLRRFAPVSVAFASGWMQIRGPRRRRAVDQGFVLSDHADWPGLLDSIRATGASRVGVTHGYTAVLVRWLREHGTEAFEIETRFEGERDDAEDVPATDEPTAEDTDRGGAALRDGEDTGPKPGAIAGVAPEPQEVVS